MSWTAAIASVLYVFALLIVLHLDKSACFNFRFDLVIAQLQHDTGSLAIDLQFCRTQVCVVALGEGKHENALPRSLAHRRDGHSGSSCAHRHDHAAFRSSTGLPNERQPWLAKLCHSSWIATQGPRLVVPLAPRVRDCHRAVAGARAFRLAPMWQSPLGRQIRFSARGI